MKRTIFTAALSALTLLSCSHDITLESPDGALELKVYLNESENSLRFDLSKDGMAVLSDNSLGLETENSAWLEGLSIKSGKVLRHSEEYSMITGKRLMCSNTASTRKITVTNAAGEVMNMEFRLFNDGLAFRYQIPNGSGAVTSDHTSYTIPDGTGR